MEFQHYSVMAEVCMEYLRLRRGGIYFDGTLGGGGHTRGILEGTAPDGIVVGVDRDPAAVAAAGERLAGFGERLKAIHGNFKDAGKILDGLGISALDGAILDLGVSSYQLDNRERGFSYRGEEAPLDMRMDPTDRLTAYDVVNSYDADKLTRLLFEYGEEKFARRIAQNIVAARGKKPVETCGELADIVKASIPAAARRQGGHPAKRAFQAIRIEVNGELEGLGEAVSEIALRLKKTARLCVLTFHSLEDRLVKNAFRELERDCVCDPRAPVCTCGKRKEIKILTRKPITASPPELEQNQRSQSAKLRVCERI